MGDGDATEQGIVSHQAPIWTGPAVSLAGSMRKAPVRTEVASFMEGQWRMAVLFTADTHFGHAGALALYHRPFKSVAEMDTALIERLNQAVRPEDEV
jgi:hypothetical protein